MSNLPLEKPRDIMSEKTLVNVLEHTEALGRASYKLEELAAALTQAQARCAELEKDADLLRFVRKDNPVTVRMWQDMFDAALKEPR